MADGNNSIDDIQQAVAARVEEEAADIVSKDDSPLEISDAIKWSCLKSNERGDGCLFAHLHRGKLVYNNVAEQWMCWTGHQWKFDDMGEHHTAVEDVAQSYSELLPGLNEELKDARANEDAQKISRLNAQKKKVEKRIEKLQSENGVSACIKMARRTKDTAGNWVMGIGGNEIDQHPMLLSCPNGIVDLRNGKLRDGRPSDYLVRTCNVPYLGIDAPDPKAFLEFLDDIQPGRPEIVKYILRTLGVSLSGLDWEHDFYCWYGSRGRNGKSTLMETISSMLGPLAGPIPTALLMEQSYAQGSSGPRPELVKLRGLRIAWASEVDRRQRFSAGAIKNITGGDMISARTLNSGHYHEFSPTHSLFLLTNDKPRVYGDDEAFWARFKLVEFPVHYVKDREPDKAKLERKVDPHIKAKLYAERSLILSLLVREILAYQERGMETPQSIIDNTLAYQQDEDTVFKWVEQRCDTTDPEAWTLGKELFADFNTWITEEGYSSQGWGRITFGEAVKRKFKQHKRNKGEGFYGITLKMSL